jgi:hypothetical protein
VGRMRVPEDVGELETFAGELAAALRR